MTPPPINVILATNLAHQMQIKGLKQQGLAKLSGVAQRTISNYLNPHGREAGKTAKAPSAKLSEVELIANALGLEAWELLRFVDASEREFYQQVEAAYRKLIAEASKATAKST